MSARLLILSFVCVVLACSEDDTRARGRLATPVALTPAPSSAAGALGGQVIFVASADDEELRVFLPDSGLFVRGPNAISPLSIPTGFRPQALAAGEVDGKGFVVGAGGEGALVTVSADTFRVTRAKGDEAACANAQRAPSCMQAPVIDVAGRGADVVAVTASPGASEGELVAFVASVEDEAPVLTVETVVPLAFEPAAVAMSTDGELVWVADAKAPAVTEVRLADGATRVFSAVGRIRRLVEVPAYTDANGDARPAGSFLLALLADGRLQTLDLAAGGEAADPLSPSEAMTPLTVFSKRFGVPTPIRDLAFIPCAGENCRTALRIRSGRVEEYPLMAMAALGDGTALPLVVDAAFPQVFRPIDLDDNGPSVSDVAVFGSMPEANPPALVVDPSSLTAGVTRRESVSVTFEGTLPRFDTRRATLDGDGLEDSLGGFDGPEGVRIGDVARLTFLGEGCPRSADVEIMSVTDTRLGFTTAPSTADCVDVVYSVVARADAPWTVVGSVSGMLGRAAAGHVFSPELARFYYPEGMRAGRAFAFTISDGDAPAPGTRFSFSTTSGLSSVTLNDDPDLRPIGLANGVAALPGLAFLAASGEDALVALKLDQQGLARGTVVFR